MASPAEIDRAAAEMASEWEQSLAAVAGDGQEGDPSHDEFAEASKRVLNQDEIDSLLGFDASGKGAGEASGIQAIVNSALVSYERLPMLEVVFDRLVRLISTSMRNFTSDNVEVSLDSVASVRFGDYLNGVPLPAHAERHQGARMGQLRSDHHRLGADLLDRRRAARRPPRDGGDAHRGPALHDDRALAGGADGAGRSRRPERRVSSR